MFYAHFVLAKKGPLARIWLAAHWDKKLTKAHVYETNIEQSVEGIMQPKVKMALRTSGHLLLGVVRIYSRKAKYLLADCNEAFVKIKMAFRPGMVDLPEDKREAAMNAITLPDVFHDFDTDMPDLDDMDIQHQFAMNQTRAEEITMREDYGNITLSTGDDGFGEEMHMEAPEMLREASHMPHFGEELSLEVSQAKPRDQETESSLQSIELPVPSTSEKQLDAPIGDDGFGGAGLPDILAGGLFEEGSLFGEHLTEPPQPPESSFGGDDFGGPPSPMHSDGSRSPSPAEEPLSEVPAPPQLDATPVSEPPSVSVPPSPAAPLVDHHDQTTLLHNEEESFALAPVEASVLKGEKRKRKRKLIVDDIKAISGEGMKAQLSDSADIVTTLDIAPPTKRLMHWKETGGVDELFNLPARTLGSKAVLANYKKCLKIKVDQGENYDADKDAESLNLEYIGVEKAFEAEKRAPPKERAALKRKRHDSESAYAKRQQELVRQQEEFARQTELARQGRISLTEEDDDQQVSGVEGRLAEHDLSKDIVSASTSGLSAQAATPEGPLTTPAHSVGFPTPAHQPEIEQSGLFGASAELPPPSADLTGSFTEQWVNQVQKGGEIMSPHYDDDDDHGPPDLPDHDDDDEEQPEEDEEDDFPADIDEGRAGEDSEMMEDETIEQFEDRVLNKRAAQMHRLLDKKFDEQSSLELDSLFKRNSRKQVAQKFYSILVLQKVMAVDANQSSDSYGLISIEKGPKFDAAIKLL